MKYAFIQQHQERFKVNLMCQALEVSRSGYYEWCQRPESRRQQENRHLGEKVKASHERSRKTYGARRIRQELVEEGESISRTRVARLMKQQKLESKRRRQFKATPQTHPTRPAAPNILNPAFETTRPDRVYVGDITFIPTEEGWLYLAVLIDLYSRAVVGWAMSARINATLTHDALMMAIWKRRPAPGLIVHSDRGSQYTSELYQKTLSDYGFICSMSRRGCCYDNAPAESFFNTLKTELTHHRRYLTRAETQQEIFEYLEVFYNRQRRHSAIGYQTPVDYEKQYRKIA